MTLLELIQQKKLIIAPGVFDGLSAKLDNLAGFKAIYASGGAISRSFGLPDIGLLTMTEVVNKVTEIVNMSKVPVIADIDTGFGNKINLQRTIQEFEKIGVQAVHLEDQSFPKRCGHLKNKSLISINEMQEKIQVAINTRKNKDFLIISRTDAIAVEGFNKSIFRAKKYIQAGADMIFVEAPETYEQIIAITKELPNCLKLINMFHGGKTPFVPTKELQNLGYNVVIIPSDLQRIAIKSMQKALVEIQENGSTSKINDELISFQEREKIVATTDFIVI